jgi:hypothetical protein
MYGDTMALTYNLQEIPFRERTTLITDLERIQNIRTNGVGGMFPVPYYDTEDGFFLMSSTTHSLIFLTMAVGISSITKRNWTTFYGRVAAEEAIHGARQNTWNEDTQEYEALLITPQDVLKHVGLSTNSGDMTVAQWRKNLLDGFVRRAERRASSSKESA